MPTTQITPTSIGTNLNPTTPTQICPPNPSRSALIIHNPNPTGTIWVAPIGTVATAMGAGSFMIVAGADRTFADTTRATCGWMGIMGTGLGNVSVLEFVG